MMEPKQYLVDKQQAYLLEHEKLGQIVSRGGTDMRSANHSCSVGLDGLTSTVCSELKVSTIHIGKKIELTTITFATPPYYGSVDFIAEDDDGDAVKVCVYGWKYNHCTTVQMRNELPLGTQIAIKEPYFKRYGDGTHGIRIDNPLNLLEIVRFGTKTQETKTGIKYPANQTASASVIRPFERLDLNERKKVQPLVKCSFCGNVSNSLKKCAGCHLAAYCDKKCQKKHWKAGHKVVCQNDPIPVRPDLNLVRGVMKGSNQAPKFPKGYRTQPQTLHPFEFDVNSWAMSKPAFFNSGLGCACHCGETATCTIRPFTEENFECKIRILCVSQEIGVGVCTKKHGKMGLFWKYTSDGLKFCSGEDEPVRSPFGLPFTSGDTVTVRLIEGRLEFDVNDQNLGAAFVGFEKGPYFLRVHLSNSYLLIPTAIQTITSPLDLLRNQGGVTIGRPNASDPASGRSEIEIIV